MKDETAQARADAPDEAGQTRTDEQAELQAEQESAAAMDADVPQPPDEAETDAGPAV